MVVENVAGMARAGKAACATPYFSLAHFANMDTAMTADGGPKLEIAFLTGFVKNVVLRTFLVTDANVKVDAAQVKVSKAFDKGPEKLAMTGDTASTTKMREINILKISSVKRVRYLTKLEAEVKLDAMRIPLVHKPVQA